MRGENGNDTFLIGFGQEIIDGGTGIDTVNYSAAYRPTGVNVNLATGLITDSDGTSDSISNVENVVGTMHSDIITGNSSNNLLDGRQGNDIISGGAGVDNLYGREGSDIFLFEAASAFNGNDYIQDFSTVEGDVIDISDLLFGYDPLTDDITDFVMLGENTYDSYIHVDTDGSGGVETFRQILTIENVTGLGDVEDMITNGQLLVA